MARRSTTVPFKNDALEDGAPIYLFTKRYTEPNMKSILLSFPLAALFCAPAQAQPAYPPQMSGARTEVYKTIGGAKLNLYIFGLCAGI